MMHRAERNCKVQSFVGKKVRAKQDQSHAEGFVSFVTHETADITNMTNPGGGNTSNHCSLVFSALTLMSPGDAKPYNCLSMCHT